MVITSDRDVFVGAHVTGEAKERLRSEALRRNMSMSALVAQIIDNYLTVAVGEEVDVRSNRRNINPNEADIPLPFEQPTS